MNRRFISAGLTSYSQALQSLTREEVSMSVFQYNLTISTGGEGEWDLIVDILYSADSTGSVKTEYPYLYKQLETEGQGIYDYESAWEFHKLSHTPSPWLKNMSLPSRPH